MIILSPEPGNETAYVDCRRVGSGGRPGGERSNLCGHWNNGCECDDDDDAPSVAASNCLLLSRWVVFVMVMEYGILVVVVADRPATPPIISLPMLGITPTNNASAADRRMSSLNLPSASLVMEEAMTLHLKRERESHPSRIPR